MPDSLNSPLSQPGITIRPHAGVSGRVKLSSNDVQTRSVASTAPATAGSPFFLQQGLVQVSFGGTRDLVGNNVLEIEDLVVEDPAALEADPLQIELTERLQPDEVLFPVTFDGEFYRVLGESVVEDNGQTVVNIRQLPLIPGGATSGDGLFPDESTRSLGNALKLAFFKLALRQNDLNKLCWVDFLPDGTVEHKTEGLAQKVAAAEHVLLLIHGIIGNTQDIATGILTGDVLAGKPLHQTYDLVLSYDYENLHTSIDDTARQLRDALKEVGFGREDGKTLSVLAHSMGGLVTRWMVEREGGHEYVDALILAGTPNNGSNFGKIEGFRKFSVTVLDLALNFLPHLIPFAATALKILKTPANVLVTLGQMNPKSDFLAKLNQSQDPHVAYFVVGGDATQYEVDGEGFQRFLEKLELGVGHLVNPGERHDIAVELKSIFNAGAWEQRQPQPQVLTPICHHLNYFHSQAGMTALVEVGLGTRQAGGVPVSSLEANLRDSGASARHFQSPKPKVALWDRLVAKLREWMNV